MNITEEKIIIGGVKQSILTLCTDVKKPILLIVHGGPGSPDRPLVCEYNKSLANDFTVVCWDQRCSGLSYTDEGKKTALSVELMLSDLKELVRHLLNKYGKEKLYLAGHSWGAYLGICFANAYPQYLYYYIGTGQGISSKLDEIEKYNFVLKESNKRNDMKAKARLIEFGEPNGGVYPNDDEKVNAFVGKLIHNYGGYIHPNSGFSMKKYFSLYPQYYGLNIFKVIAGINYSVKNLTPQMKKKDIIPSIKSLEVPILLIFGELDYICPVATAKRWFDELSAPQKNFVIIPDAAHMVNFEQPQKWNELVCNCLKD